MYFGSEVVEHITDCLVLLVLHPGLHHQLGIRWRERKKVDVKLFMCGCDQLELFDYVVLCNPYSIPPTAHCYNFSIVNILYHVAILFSMVRVTVL